MRSIFVRVEPTVRLVTDAEEVELLIATLAFGASNLRPILFAHVIIDLNGLGRWIQLILPVLLRAGNPVIFTALHIEVVGLKASALEALKCFSSIVNRGSSFGEGHATNASWTAQTTCLVLDVHDASFHGTLNDVRYDQCGEKANQKKAN